MRLLGLFVTFALTALAGPLAAESYRLVVGDLVTVDYDFLETPKTTMVDLDGNIRLSELGSITAADRTLDEVETAISEGMVEGGFSGVSFVSVEVSQYAPIVVSGFVERSGRYDYLPGMSVGSALALAGGLGSEDVAGPNADVLAVNAGRRAATAAENIALAVTTIAGLEAALAGPDAPVTLSPVLRDLVPRDQQGRLDGQIAAQTDRIQVERERAAALLASWESEIEDFSEQIELFNARIAVKEQALVDLEEEFADLENLRSQGLATTARTSTLQQRLADDREELLALENSKVVARRARSLAERNRVDFLTTQQRNRLMELREARANLQLARSDHRFALEELTVLSEDNADLPLLQEALEVRFTVQGPRAARLDGVEIDRDTPLLPGDILVVDVEGTLDLGVERDGG